MIGICRTFISAADSRIFPFLVDMVIKSSLILALLLVAKLVLCRASAAIRSVVWIMGIVVALGLMIVPIGQSAHSVAPVTYTHQQSNAASGTALSQTSGSAESSSPQASGSAGGATLTVQDSNADSEAGSETGTDLFEAAFVAVWLIGVLASFLTLAMRLIALRRIYNSASKTASLSATDLLSKIGSWPEARAVAVRLRSVRQFHGKIEIATASNSSPLVMPSTWGVCSHVVLLPPGNEEWDSRRRQTVLLHELAHIVRYDWVTQLIVSVLCSIYWFNPLAWIAANEFRQECERASDDFVLAIGTEPKVYASELLEIAKSSYSSRYRPAYATAMVRHNKLESRLRAIMAQHVSRAESSFGFEALCGIALVAVILWSTGYRFALADNRIVSQSLSSATMDPSRQPLWDMQKDIYATVAPSPSSAVKLTDGVTIKLDCVTDSQQAESPEWSSDAGALFTKPVILNYDWYPRDPKSASKSIIPYDPLPPGAVGRVVSADFLWNNSQQPTSVWVTKPSDSSPNGLKVVKPFVQYDGAYFEHERNNEFDGIPDHSTGAFIAWGKIDGQRWSFGDAYAAKDNIASIRLGVAAGPWSYTALIPNQIGTTHIVTDYVTISGVGGQIIQTSTNGGITLSTKIATLLPVGNEHPLINFATGQVSNRPRFRLSGRNMYCTMSAPVAGSKAIEHLSISDNLAIPQHLPDGFRSLDRRIECLDSAGHVITDLGWSETVKGSQPTTLEADIPKNLPLKVAYIRFKARPIYWVEFDNVRLYPNRT